MSTFGRREHTLIHQVRDPLLFVGDVDGVGWDEFAQVRLDGNPVRHALVLEVDGDLAVLQVLEGTDGIDPSRTRVVFAGQPLHVPTGPGWLGRVCNGRGAPVDGGPPVVADQRSPVAGLPLNPLRRQPPAEPVLTGLSAIDGFATVVRGQKLPIFSVAGLPHLAIATQVAAQASAAGEPFCVVFAGMGLTHADAAAVRDSLEERSAAGELALELALEIDDDPVALRARALDLGPRRLLFPEVLDHLIEVAVADLDLRLLDLDLVESLELDLGHDLEGRNVSEALAVALGFGLDSRAARRAQVFLLHRVGVTLLHQIGQHLLANLRAVAPLDDLGGHLARAKTLDLDRLADRLEAAIDLFFDAFGGQLHAHAALQRTRRFDSDLHGFNPFRHQVPLATY